MSGIMKSKTNDIHYMLPGFSCDMAAAALANPVVWH
jgi:hypothetical protein